VIEKLYIKNFQRHAKSKIDLDQVTTIVGRSDSGKSAVIRALRWVMLNQPRGAEFVKHGEDDCAVRVVIDEKDVVRRKTKKANEYEMLGRDFVAFGSNVPEPIADFLAVDELNFQDQHDPPFWLSLSAGEVSKRINEIVDLSIVDETLQRSKSRQKKAKDKVAAVQTNFEDIKKKCEDLEWTVECNEDLKEIKEFRERSNRLVNLVGTLTGDIVRLEGTRELIVRMMPLADEGQDLVKDFAVAGKVGKQCKQLSELVNDICDKGTSIERKGLVDTGDNVLTDVNDYFCEMNYVREAKELVGQLSDLEASISPVPDFPDVGETIVLHGQLAMRRSTLQADFLQKMTELGRGIKSGIHHCNDLVDELEQKTEGKCPICGGDIDV
jgi:hypothetical protein